MRQARRILGWFLLLFGACLLVAGASWAGNVDTYGIGSRATALGGAYAANAEGPFAAYYNPAGLTQTDRPVVSAGLMVISPDLEAKNYKVENNNNNADNLGPTDVSDESDDLYPPHLGFAMPINDRWSVGLAAYAPFGLHLEWEENPHKNPMAYNTYESWYDRRVVTPTAAYKVNNQLSLGFGISLGRSTAGKKYNVYDVKNLAQVKAGGDPSFGDAATLEADLTDDFNYSANIGVMYKPAENWNIGITYRSFTDADFDGDLEVNDVAQGVKKALDAKGLALKDEYDASLDDVDHPDQVQLGVRFQPYKTLSMEVDVVWTRWSMIEEQTVDINDADEAVRTLLGEEKIDYKRDWEDTRQVRVGIEWQTTDMVTLRGGYFYDPSPIPDDTFDAQWPDADKKTYSLGAGFDITDNWTVDTVVQYTVVEQDRIIGGESVELNDSYDSNVEGVENDANVSTKADGDIWGYGLTVSYKF